MTRAIELEILKLRVPLSQAWDEAIKRLLNMEERNQVVESALSAAILLEAKFGSDDQQCGEVPELYAEARQSALEFVQAKFSGVLPEIPDRESDLLSQHKCIWSLLGQLIKASSGRIRNQEEILTHAVSVLSSPIGGDWKHRARNILMTIANIKGTTDERLNSLCLSEVFLCERELVTPSVSLLVKSKEFKEIMNAPDMVQDGEKTLPKLLLNLSHDKEFRHAFVWLPLDPESPLNVSGGSGMMPTDKSAYRYVLAIIMKILFGKLRQRGNGIDKRSSFAERQNQIMSYLGTAPVSELGIVFKVLLGRVINEKVDVENFKPEWNGECFIDSVTGEPIVNRTVLESNPSLTSGIIQTIGNLISQMKRKIDRFVPLLTLFVVSGLSWTDETRVKPLLVRLAELMHVYQHIPYTEWEALLNPIQSVLIHHVSKSSAAALSTVFRIITQWCYSENLINLYCTDLGASLLEELFKPRALSGTTASALFGMVLCLLGEEEESARSKTSSFLESRKQLIREHKRTGGDMDSEDEDDTDMTDFSSEKKILNSSQQIVVKHICSIVSTVSLSLSKASDESQALQVTVGIAKLAASRGDIALPEEACTNVLELISEQLKQMSALSCQKARKAAGQTYLLLEACMQLVSLVSAGAVPHSLLGVSSRLVLSMDDVRGRVVLSQNMFELSKKISVSEVAQMGKLVELNSIKASGASLQPDIDKHIDVFQDLLESDELDQFLTSTPLIRHCLFIVSSVASDSTVRHCAERFLSLIGRVRDSEGRLPVPRLTMVMGHLHRVLDLHSSDATYRSCMKLVVCFVKDYASQLEGEAARLLHKDLLPFTDPSSVLEDLQHIQRYRRCKALGKLVDGASELSDHTKQKLLTPLAIDGIMQPGVAKSSYDAALADVSLRAIQICPEPVGLMIGLVKTYLRKFEDREKIILRAVSKITERVCLGDVDVGRVESVLVPLLRKRVFDSKGSLKASTLIGDQTEKHRFARDSKSEHDGFVRIETVVALLEVLKLLPCTSQTHQTEQLVRIVLKGLPSRELINRRAAREALRRCAKVLGADRLAWLMKEIRHALPRGGFQAAVAVFTCFSVVESLVGEVGITLSHSASVDLAGEILECLRIEDKQWAMQQSRADATSALDEDTQLAKQCVEAKRHKAHEMLELGAKILPCGIVTSVLVRSVFSQFNAAGGADIEVSEDEEMEEPQVDSADDSEAENVPKRKRRKIYKESTDIQLHAVHGKKFFTRIENALVSALEGIKQNTSYSPEQRLGLCVQVLVQFEDIVSRKFQLDESVLFEKNELNRALLNIDEDGDSAMKHQKGKRNSQFRQQQKEQHFLVQPGASTGRGHWVTEEWKRGKLTTSSQDERSKQIGSVDLRAIKSRILGSIGLKLLNTFTHTEIAQFDLEVRTALGKLVTRSFCSGIAELFQPSAKAIQKLLMSDANASVLNGKAMSMIAKRLMTCMEQLHHGGSDLSFITLKQQRKTQTSDIAVTCSSLLLSLVNSEQQADQWLNTDMLETLAAHVRASLDKPSLQVAALAILKKLLVAKKHRSATIYDCLKLVSDLIVTASNPKVCALCGHLYAQFLIDFPHTDKALSEKLVMLLKQGYSASSALSRCTALNTVHSFARALPVKMLQETFGEIIVVTLAVNVAAEEDVKVREMMYDTITLVLSRFKDDVKRNRLIDAIAQWPGSMTKYQFVLGAAEILTLLTQSGLVNSEKSVAVVQSVVRQIPFLIVPTSMDSHQLSSRGFSVVVRSVQRMISSLGDSGEGLKLVQFIAGHLLSCPDVSVHVVTDVLRFVNHVTASDQAGKKLFTELPQDEESVRLTDSQVIESCAPWPLLMRILRVLVRDTTEQFLEIPSLAMRAIAGLVSFESSGKPIKKSAQEVVVAASDDEVELSKTEMGLFGKEEAKIETEQVEIRVEVNKSERLVSLMKKIRYEVRGLMAKPREACIRLASLLKLTAALTLSIPAAEDEGLLSVSLETLIRLATINRTAEEMSTEVPEVNSLFELSVLRPIEQIGCLSKMANTALESIEKHYKDHAGLFSKQLTQITTVINKTRRDRKISLLNLAVSNPARLAMLRLQKSKKKTDKRQAKAKENVKRIKGLIQ